ncbi:hypothetical protein MARCHEWKA_01970 [Brevundimonas phage vB_BpoS-Marchewka]|uniref:Uncharacterized protein n=1 Tax=Brevundimonas phage vB_BpoS-Marchewka TaxID=2948604 RepID=A0A9E7N454_9CAUD|nr:hypothetical protein MARCHEWKA_01970 [Brevundimonas phage vB_BpoS-Marchewka]
MNTRDNKTGRQPLSLMANVPCLLFGGAGVVLTVLGILLPLRAFQAAEALLPVAVVCFIFAWACFVQAETTD